MNTNYNNLTSKIISYEQDELTENEIIELFQQLLDSGLVWQLQGCYGRQAQALIDAGLIGKGKGSI